MMMPACHANFKTKLNQVNTDTGEQYLDTGQQGKIPPDLEVVSWRQKEPYHLT